MSGRPSRSQGSTRRTTRRTTNRVDLSDISDEEGSNGNKVHRAVHLVLGTLMKKHGALKEPRIKKALGKDDINNVNSIMEDVFGCKIASEDGRFFLLNSLSNRLCDPAVRESHKNEAAKNGLLMVVLLFIHMSKNPVVEQDMVPSAVLWSFLSHLGVSADSVGVFGLPSDLIAPSPSAEFVASGWLSFTRKKSNLEEGDSILYDWGPRAYTVLCPMKMLQTFCKIMDEDPEDWKEHYEKAKSTAHTSSEGNIDTIDD